MVAGKKVNNVNTDLKDLKDLKVQPKQVNPVHILWISFSRPQKLISSN